MPSLYETTAAVGDVSSSNFTTLYNSSGLSAPNTGGGAVSGNLNVGGNLTVQGTSLLQGAVTLGSTLSLPNYTFPSTDGGTDMVLTTDGSGNLIWQDVQLLPGADYTINASTTTGGANLNLVSGVATDSVKFAGGTNITVTRTDDSTITISTVADNIPDGTAAGQVLEWDGSAWTANNVITALTSTGRLVAEYKDNTTTTTSSFAYRRNTGSTAFTTGTTATILAQLDSDSQAVTSFGSSGFQYSATNPAYAVSTSVDNFATRTFLQVMDSTEIGFNGSNLILNRAVTGAPSSNASITVERGTSTDATLTWNETTDTWDISNGINVAGPITATGIISTSAESISMNSDNTATDSVLNFKGLTQYIKWNNTTQQFELSNAAVVGGNLTVNGVYSQTGESMTINSDSTAADSYLYMKGSTEYLKWNNTDTRFEFSDQLFISQSEPAAVFEVQKTTADTNNEGKPPLKLIQRVTDALNNQTDDGGANILFARTSGASGGTETQYSTYQSDYFGTTNKASHKFIWTTDNFTEPTPGSYPATYTLLNVGSDNSQFFNNSLYIDYNNVVSTKTATTITGGNTLTFGGAHGYSAGQRLQFQGTTQNGLIQSAYYYVLATGLTSTQCQVSLISGGTAATLTNGTGLTLTFAILQNLVGINTVSPAYTLDVDGDVNVTGDIYVSGYQIDINSPQAGQMIEFDGTKFVNNNTLTYTDSTYRTQVRSDIGVAGRTVGALLLVNDTGSTAYGQNDGSGIIIGVDSDSQSPSIYASMTAAYDASGNHELRWNTSTDNFATDTATSITGGNTLVFGAAHGFSANQRLLYASTTSNGLTEGTYYYVLSTGLTTTQCQISLTQGGSAVALTNGTGLSLVFNTSVRVVTADYTNARFAAQNIVLNTANTGIAGVDSGLTVERGTSGADATFKWIESNTRWQSNASIYTLGNLIADGPNIQVNADSTAADSFLYMKGTSKYLSFDNAQDRFEFNDALEVQGQITGTSNLDLAGNSITLLNGTASGADAYIYVDRGSSGTDASIKWEEANTFWRVSNSLYADDGVIGGNYIATNGNNIYFNNESTNPAGTSNLTVKNGVSSGVNSTFRWNDTTKRWQDTTDGSTYYDLPNQNLDTTSDVSFGGITLDGRSTFNTGATTTTSTSAFTLDETNRNAIKLMCYIEQGTESHALEILIMRTSTSAMMTTYGEMYTTTPLATFTADQSAGNIRVRCTPTSATSTTFSVVRYSLT